MAKAALRDASASGLCLSVLDVRSKLRRSGSRCEKQGNCRSKEKAVRAEEAEEQLEKKSRVSRQAQPQEDLSQQLVAAGRSSDCRKGCKAAPEPPHGAHPSNPLESSPRFLQANGSQLGGGGAVLPREHVAVSADGFGGHDWKALLVSDGWRAGMLLHTVRYTGQPPPHKELAGPM